MGSVTTYSETIFPEQQKVHHRMSKVWRPAAGEKDDYVICEETSEASVIGLDWLQESIWQPTSHLGGHSLGVVLCVSNSKTICGDIDERMEDWNLPVAYWRAHQEYLYC